MFIAVRNRHDGQSSNPGWGCLTSLCTNTLGKSVNLNLLPLAIGKF